MRIVSWNIGLRGLDKICSPNTAKSQPDIHGICRKQSYGSLAALLEALDADIVCLQEVKLRELGGPERRLALLDGWDSYFSLCRTRNAATSYGRYAGVATFCKSRLVSAAHPIDLLRTSLPSTALCMQLPISVSRYRPRAASEGITGILDDGDGAVGHVQAVSEALSAEVRREIDSEGRCLITLHGDLALVNIYAPAVCKSANEAADAEAAAAAERRVDLKAAFLAALEMRARSLLDARLRVLIIGDFNVTPAPLDSARELESAMHGAGASRTWLQNLLRHGFVDAWRLTNPGRVAFSCFHVASGADAFNFGSRIDLALIAPHPVPKTTRRENTATRGEPTAALPPTVLSPAESFTEPVAQPNSHNREGCFSQSDALTTVERNRSQEQLRLAPSENDSGASSTPLIGARDASSALYRCTGDESEPDLHLAEPLTLVSCDIEHEIEGSDHVPVSIVVEGVGVDTCSAEGDGEGGGAGTSLPQLPLSSAARLGTQTLLTGFVRPGARRDASSAPSDALSVSSVEHVGVAGCSGAAPGGRSKHSLAQHPSSCESRTSSGPGAASAVSTKSASGACGGQLKLRNASISSFFQRKLDVKTTGTALNEPSRRVACVSLSSTQRLTNRSAQLGDVRASHAEASHTDISFRTDRHGLSFDAQSRNSVQVDGVKDGETARDEVDGFVCGGNKNGFFSADALAARSSCETCSGSAAVPQPGGQTGGDSGGTEQHVMAVPSFLPAKRGWQELLQVMGDSTPRCKGHQERRAAGFGFQALAPSPCSLRTVKKPGPNNGKKFWTCPRAEGPRSNPSCNCGFFVWHHEHAAKRVKHAVSAASAPAQGSGCKR